MGRTSAEVIVLQCIGEFEILDLRFWRMGSWLERENGEFLVAVAHLQVEGTEGLVVGPIAL
jgi:hypothetical protein